MEFNWEYTSLEETKTQGIFLSTKKYKYVISRVNDRKIGEHSFSQKMGIKLWTFLENCSPGYKISLINSLYFLSLFFFKFPVFNFFLKVRCWSSVSRKKEKTFLDSSCLLNSDNSMENSFEFFKLCFHTKSSCNSSRVQ